MFIDHELECSGIMAVMAVGPPKDFSPDWFDNPNHQKIAQAICSVAADGDKPDLVSVVHRLRVMGNADMEPILLSACEDTMWDSHCQTSLNQLRNWSKRRSLVRAIREVAKEAETAPLDLVAAKMHEISMKAMPSSDLQLVRAAEMDIAGIDAGVISGIPIIDTNTSCGGWPRGQLSVVSAYTKGGKSTTMIQSALNCASAGFRVLYATFADLPGRQIVKRMHKMLSGQWDSQYAAGLLDALDLFVLDAAKSKGKSDILQHVHTFEEYDVVFLDYAQKLRYGGISCALYEGAIQASDLLAVTAAEFNNSIIVGSQITNPVGGVTVTKGSRSWEEDAGLVFRVKREPDSKEMVGSIEYNRWGEPGKNFGVWNSQYVKIDWESTPATLDV